MRYFTRPGVIFTTGNTSSINASADTNTVWRIRRFQNTWNLGLYFNRIFRTTSTGVSEGTIAHYIYGIYRLDYIAWHDLVPWPRLLFKSFFLF